jgi:hypothetical protein
VRSALVTALLACSDSSLRVKARRFLQGLSSDELQFIAEYLGACILESNGTCHSSMPKTSTWHSSATSADGDLKMILVREYLRRSGQPAALNS